ncbi:MAG TPA: hypothetical protein VIJ93_09450 [bacterium]
MAPEFLAPGVQVVHTKMQIIGTVVKVIDDLVHVKIAENKPIQIWKKEDLAVWDQRGELQKRLKRGGYIQDIYKKKDD